MSKPLQITILSLSVVLAFILGTVFVENISTEGIPGYLHANGQIIPVYPGSEIEVFIEDENALVAQGKGKGADLSTTVDSFAAKFQTAAPNIDINGASSLGGTAAHAAKGLAAKGHMIIIFAGVLCVIGGVVCAVKWDRRMGTWIAAAGGALIVVGVAFERYPILALLLPLIGIGIIVYFWYRTRKGTHQQLALNSIVTGVNNSPGEVASSVKENIAAAANTTGAKDIVKAEITAIKKALHIT